jgi:hypothetical protein
LGTVFNGTNADRKTYSKAIDLTEFTKLTSMNSGWLCYLDDTTIILPNTVREFPNYALHHDRRMKIAAPYEGKITLSGSFFNSSTQLHIYVKDDYFDQYTSSGTWYIFHKLSEW